MPRFRLPISRRQAANCKKDCCKNGDTPQTTALADLLARQDLLTDDATADLTEAQQLLSTLTPSLKSNALNALSKTARQDDNAPALSDEDLANLSALFAMLPGQPALTPTTRTASAEGALSAPASLRGDTRAAMQDAVAGLTTGELKKGKSMPRLTSPQTQQATSR